MEDVFESSRTRPWIHALFPRGTGVVALVEEYSLLRSMVARVASGARATLVHAFVGIWITTNEKSPMTTRRDVLTAIGSGLILPSGALAKSSDSFDALFARARAHPELLLNTREEREGMEFSSSTRKAFPHYPPPGRDISKRAKDLIVLFEVSGESLYKKKYQNPIWPKGRSGVTIAIGYDCGYVDEDWLRSDWKSYLGEVHLAALAKTCNVRGEGARKLLPDVKTVTVSWKDAKEQFEQITLPRYISETMRALPNCERLNDDCMGALVSLDYNRGPSFGELGDRYAQMRNIRTHMARWEPRKIPNEIRGMKWIWQSDPNMRGLLERRDLEAALFERGLKSQIV